MAPDSHPHNRDDVVLSTKKPEDRRVAVGTLVGTAVEWYDFFIYANAAAIVFAPLFFDPFVQSSGEVAGRLISFATVGISFFFRPLGAAIAGHFGDRIGRKSMLVAPQSSWVRQRSSSDCYQRMRPRESSHRSRY